MYDIVLFDLDGTLTESAPGITNSVAYALNHYGINVEDRSTLNKFVGPPLIDSFMKYFDFTKERAEEAVDVYREYFSTKGLFENSVYEGIPELLKKIKATGRKVMLATSKPDRFAIRILEHFDLIQYFDYIAGATMDEKRTHKDEVIDYLLKENAISDVTRVVMVGDRENDVSGSKKFGIDCIGVLYGYGSLEELNEAGAKYIAKTPADVFGFL